MNCDHVFSILTRGPFPAGEPTDREVESHLQHCAGCQRLARALQPAVTLLHESIPADECRDLPGYWGRLFDQADETTARGVIAVLPFADRLAWPRTCDAPMNRWWRFAAAMALGAVLVVALWGTG
jgi:hypothetical protein